MKKNLLTLVCSAAAVALTSTLGAQTDRPATTPIHAVVWNANGSMHDLGTLGGNISYGFGINDLGVVVGYSSLADNVTFHAFFWSPSRGMVDVGTTLPTGASSWGLGINASGTAAVTAFRPDGSALPSVLHRSGFFRHLPVETTLTTLNRSYGINDANQVTGQFYNRGIKTGFLWDVATSTVTYVPAMEGGSETVGVAVNNLSHVTGAGSDFFGNYIALIWSADQGTRYLGSLNESAFTAGGGINNNDEVVGYNLPELAGFYWSDARGMVPLRSLGGSVSAAVGINDSGMIVGYGGLPDGTVHAVRWTQYTNAPQDLGTLTGSGNSYGKGINRFGQVVGYSEVP